MAMAVVTVVTRVVTVRYTVRMTRVYTKQLSNISKMNQQNPPTYLNAAVKHLSIAVYALFFA